MIPLHNVFPVYIVFFPHISLLQWRLQDVAWRFRYFWEISQMPAESKLFTHLWFKSPGAETEDNFLSRQIDGMTILNTT